MMEQCPNPRCVNGYIDGTPVGCAVCGRAGRAVAPEPTDDLRLRLDTYRRNVREYPDLAPQIAALGAEIAARPDATAFERDRRNPGALLLVLEDCCEDGTVTFVPMHGGISLRVNGREQSRGASAASALAELLPGSETMRNRRARDRDDLRGPTTGA